MLGRRAGWTLVAGTLAAVSIARAESATPSASIVVTPAIRSVANAPAGNTAGSPATDPRARPAARAAASAYPVAWDGQMRYRYETLTLRDHRLSGAFGRPVTQAPRERGDVSLMRTRLGATLGLGPGVRGHIGLQDARTWGAAGSPSGPLANVDLYDAYLDLDSLGAGTLGLRVGRQVLDYDDDRAGSGSEGSNAARGFDGARLRYARGRVQAGGFAAWTNEGRFGGKDRLLWGIDALWSGSHGFDVEGYHVRRAFGAAGYTAGRVTIDLRSEWKSKLLVGHMRASGDDVPGDGRFRRFDPASWSGHGFQEALDLAGAGGLADWCGGLTTQPAAAWTVQSEYHALQLMRARDAAADDTGTQLGQELDVSLRWEARPRVTLLAGGSRFWAGSHMRKTDGGADVAWGYTQMTLSF